MDKKLWKSISIRVGIVLALVAAYLLVSNLNKPANDDSSKVVTVIVVDELDEHLYNEELATNATTLGQLIDEINDNGQTFLLEGAKDSEFGRYIDNILNVDKSSQQFWVFSSENNKVCLAEAFCPGIDLLEIDDQDEFKFYIINNEE